MDDVDAAAATDPRGRRRCRQPVQSAVAFSMRPYRPSLRLRSPIMAATSVGRNDSPMAPEDSTVSSRLGEVKINLDGTGVANYSTGIPFLDYILDVSDVEQLRGSHLLRLYPKSMDLSKGLAAYAHCCIAWKEQMESWKQNHRRCCTI